MKKKMKTLIPLVIGGVTGVVAGIAAPNLFSELDSVSDLLMAFVAMIVVYYLNVIVHEGGHLICGLLSGYKFVSFRIGSFIIYKSKNEWKVGKYKLAGTGGQCLMSPPDLVNGKIPYRLFNFGGALMNLISVVPVVLLLAYTNIQGFAKVFAGFWCLIGIISALMNGIPMSVGAVDNDGKNALNLGKNPKALYSFWLQLKVNQMQVDGYSLLEMPKEWFEMPSYEEMKNPMLAVLGALHCNYMMEEKRYKETSDVIEALLKNASGILPVHAMLLRIDQIYCEIMSSRDEKVLEFYKDKGIQKFMKAMKNYPSIIRTSYAYTSCVEMNEKKAKALKRQFEKVAKTHPNAAELQVEAAYISDCENTKLS